VSESSRMVQPNASEMDEDLVNVQFQAPFLVSVTLKLLRFLT